MSRIAWDQDESLISNSLLIFRDGFERSFPDSLLSSSPNADTGQLWSLLDEISYGTPVGIFDNALGKVMTVAADPAVGGAGYPGTDLGGVPKSISALFAFSGSAGGSSAIGILNGQEQMFSTGVIANCIHIAVGVLGITISIVVGTDFEDNHPIIFDVPLRTDATVYGITVSGFGTDTLTFYLPTKSGGKRVVSWKDPIFVDYHGEYIIWEPYWPDGSKAIPMFTEVSAALPKPDYRIYETGLDRGVLYPPGDAGVAWSGLVSVDVTEDQSSQPLYIDGMKYMDLPSVDGFSGKIKAVTYPDEVSDLFGQDEVDLGLNANNQNAKIFGLSYRTLIGNTNAGLEHGYKLHILYDLTAKPSASTSETVDSNIAPVMFEWDLASKPKQFGGNANSGHIIVDSRYVDQDLLTYLEAVLYGDVEYDARLPSFHTVISLLPSEFTIIITNNGDGTWSAEGPSELITMLDDTTFQITDVNAVYIDSDSYSADSS